MSDLHQQATELRNVAQQLRAFLGKHKFAPVAADVAERAEQLLSEVIRRVPETTKQGPISHKSEWD